MFIIIFAKTEKTQEQTRQSERQGDAREERKRRGIGEDKTGQGRAERTEPVLPDHGVDNGQEADRQQEVIHIARQTTGPCSPWSCLLDYSTASLLDYQTSIPSTANCW